MAACTLKNMICFFLVVKLQMIGKCVRLAVDRWWIVIKLLGLVCKSLQPSRAVARENENK
jgi:hypothetical protein